MNDDELWNKAHKAGLDYYAVYGVFPEKIGIHHKCVSQLKRDHIIFVEMPTFSISSLLSDELQQESISSRHHIAWFRPVVGPSIKLDEVYLPMPNDGLRVISGDDIARFAQAKTTR